MLFSSITFLYFFLPITLLLHRAVPQKWRNPVLLILSLIFYAWGEPLYWILMVLQILSAYVLTLLMDHFKSCHQMCLSRFFFILAILTPLASLFYFKYSAFFADVFSFLLPFTGKEKKLPIGISFYTFQIISYVADVQKGCVKPQKHLIPFAAYVTLFPQLAAGPIVRYSEIEKDLFRNRPHDPYVTASYGAMRFCIGLGKKILIANVLGEFVAEASAISSKGIFLSWCYALAVSLQIYFDFSGYSDMAIGLGAMLGFHFPENFRYPFLSKSLTEFWRRWHITLGAWFRDYVYIPMGGNRTGKLRWMFNLLTVWIFTGLWHGADWNFILWGLLFAVMLIFEKQLKLPTIRRGKSLSAAGCTFSLLSRLYTLFFIMISFLIFHHTDLNRAFHDILDLFSFGNTASVQSEYILRNRIGILLIGMVGSTPLVSAIYHRIQERILKIRRGELLISFLNFTAAVLLLILCTAYLIDGSFNPFLYFRF